LKKTSSLLDVLVKIILVFQQVATALRFSQQSAFAHREGGGGREISLNLLQINLVELFHYHIF